jgi:CheY-like chemotaxis protein
MDGNVIKFLLIEDDESQRMLLKSILKKNFTCEITETINGKEALEFLKSELPSLILMDLNMPVLDGPELLKIFQTHAIYKKIPVMVISANNDRNIIGSLVDKGIYDYILKPIEINSTISRINRVLSKVLNVTDATNSPNKLKHVGDIPRLLLVETDKYQRELINQLIGDKFVIQDVKNGSEALSAYEKQHHRYILLSDKVELLDKKIVTQKIREVAQDKELSIFLIHTDAKTISTKVFNFTGLIKRSIDPQQFKDEILNALQMGGPENSQTVQASD